MTKSLWSALGLSSVLVKLKGLYQWNYSAVESLFDKLSPIMPQAGAVVRELDIRLKQTLKDAQDPAARLTILQAYFYPARTPSEAEQKSLQEMANWPVRFILQEVGVLLLSRYLPRLPAERIMRAAIELAVGLIGEGATPATIQSFKLEQLHALELEDLTRYR